MSPGEDVHPHFAHPRVVNIGVDYSPRVHQMAGAVLLKKADERRRGSVVDEVEEVTDIGC